MQVFQTKRLILRHLKIDDTQLLHEILSDKETMIFYPATYSIDAVKKWVNKSIKSYKENNFGLWAVTLKDTKEFIGQCGISLQNINGKIVPEIGYHINKKFWNKSYATEAADACLGYGFKKLNLKEIFIHTYIKNIPSQRVAEKIGMKKLFVYDKYLASHDIKWKHVVFRSKNDLN